MIHRLEREREGERVSALQSESVAVSAWPRVEAVDKSVQLTQTTEGEAPATPCDNWREIRSKGTGGH